MHTLHPTSCVLSGTSNSPRGQGHGTSSVPAASIAVQRPDAIMREKDGVGCGVVLIVAAGILWNGGEKDETEEAMWRRFRQ
jgi:hypothetical protein